MNADQVKIYDASPEVLKPLLGTRLQDSVMVINDIISGIASNTKSYFFLDAYPYLTWFENPTNISLDFPFFEDVNQTYNDIGSGLIYTNLLD
ncbi:probable glucan endo-1,3-beta-glucosidase A6, partial [Olea europaea subsp. europaea]